MKTKTLLRTITLIYLFISAVNVASAANNYDFVSNGIYYKITNNSTRTVDVTFKDYSFNCYSGNVSIPVSVTYNGVTYSVTAIGSSAFKASTGLTGVTIPNSVTTIESNAFDGCSSLSNLVLPNTLTSIGTCAFSHCTSLNSITLPKKVTQIGGSVFYGCSSLTTLYYDSENCNDLRYDAFPFSGCKLINVYIGQTVKCIPAYLFAKTSTLNSIDIPNSVNRIGHNAFEGSGLVSISLSESLSTIESNTFTDCKSLKNIVIPNTVTSIGEYAFYGCVELDDINIPNSVTTIKGSAFYGCSGLNRLILPSSVIEIDEANPFQKCSGLESIVVDVSNPRYDSRDNSNAIIETATNKLVIGCKNTIIPNNVIILGREAFRGAIGLKKITIPNSVMTIGYGSFRDCDSLSNVYISESVKTIENDAFRNCRRLMSITCNSFVPPYIRYTEQENFSYETYQNALLSVPVGAIESYMNADYWSLFKHFREGTDLIDYSIATSSNTFPTSWMLHVDYDCNASVIDAYVLLDGNRFSSFCITGLIPEYSYTNVYFVLETNRGKIFNLNSFTTPALLMTAKAADMITNKDARLMAETNMADIETSCGFEWRRYDAPEEMPSAKVYCPVYGGVMAGTLKNMSENVYYKYRPFYKSSAGNEYYGDWVAFITADAGVEFEPVVYTYNSPAVTQTEATMQGVALRGSEEITEQGFEYWKTGKTNMLTASGDVTRVTARGERMSKTVSGLQAGTRYTFRAYVTAGGETTYGQEVQFVTLASSLDVNLDGEINIADVNSVISLILENGVVTTGDVNDDGEVNIADINVLIDAILGM